MPIAPAQIIDLSISFELFVFAVFVIVSCGLQELGLLAES
jgi:hypothetical protein